MKRYLTGTKNEVMRAMAICALRDRHDYYFSIHCVEGYEEIEAQTEKTIQDFERILALLERDDPMTPSGSTTLQVERTRGDVS